MPPSRVNDLISCEKIFCRIQPSRVEVRVGVVSKQNATPRRLHACSKRSLDHVIHVTTYRSISGEINAWKNFRHWRTKRKAYRMEYASYWRKSRVIEISNFPHAPRPASHRRRIITDYMLMGERYTLIWVEEVLMTLWRDFRDYIENFFHRQWGVF